MDWDSTNLTKGLTPYHLASVKAVEDAVIPTEDDGSVLYLILDGLPLYVETWDIEDGVWLALAVVKMVVDVLEDYPEPKMLGGNPVQELAVMVPLDHEQEIVHRFLTAYQELYAVVARMKMKASNRFWHRRAAVDNFPQLLIEVEDSDEAEDDNTG
ncbi:MAG: hypothetical protein L0154_15800 [Chloroflexi bacterium]|nr:hypothetical protein [Chloroflexota bacterium]